MNIRKIVARLSLALIALVASVAMLVFFSSNFSAVSQEITAVPDEFSVAKSFSLLPNQSVENLANFQSKNESFLFERGWNYEIWKNPDGSFTYKIGGIPLWAYDYSTGKYAPYIFEDKGSYIRVVNGLIGADIYPDHSIFYETNRTEVRVEKETWIFERQVSSGWKQLKLQFESRHIFQNTTGVFPTNRYKVFDGADYQGELNITFAVRGNRPLEHILTYEGDGGTYRVRQLWEGNEFVNVTFVDGTEMELSKITSIFGNEIPEAGGVKRLAFVDEERKTLVSEDLTSARDKVIAMNVDSLKKKIEFVYGTWSINYGESFVLDPDTATISFTDAIDVRASAVTGTACGTSYSKFSGEITLYKEDSDLSGYCFRAVQSFSLSSITAGSTVTQTQWKINVDPTRSNAVNCDWGKVGGTISSDSAATIWSNIGTFQSTYLTNDNTCTTWTSGTSITLGSTANTDVQNNIGGTIQIGERLNSETRDSTSAHQSALSGVGGSNIQLIVTYTPPNTAPSFSVAPVDSSDGTTPTNAGSSVTFTATATDSQSDNYYLAICKTNSVTANNNAAPTCGGGNWCISGATASGSQASCSYTTLAGDAESNDWYGFVCDNNAASLCSSNSNANSPFKVNHRPSFSAVSDSPDPVQGGATVTITTTASDSDTDTSSDTVKLYVCKASDGSSSGCGGGGTWCSASATASNPTCNFAAPTTSGSNNYYSYVFDNHDFGSSDNPRSGSFSVINAPKFADNNTYQGTTLSATNTYTYSSSLNISASVNITDTDGDLQIDTVIFGINGTGNITNKNITGGSFKVYNKSVGGQFYVNLSSLAVGTYNAFWWANDSGNAQNQTANFTITINKAGTLSQMLLNGTRADSTYEKNAAANFTATINISGKTANIDTNITGWSVQSGTDSVTNVSTLTSTGKFNITGYFVGDANYSASSETFYATVSDTTAPTITVQQPTNTTYYTASVWANVTLNEAGSWCGRSLDSGSNVTLTNSSGNWNNQMTSLSQLAHNVRVYCNDTSGNMAASSAVFFTVNSPLCYTSTNISQYYACSSDTTEFSPAKSSGIYYLGDSSSFLSICKDVSSSDNVFNVTATQTFRVLVPLASVTCSVIGNQGNIISKQGLPSSPFGTYALSGSSKLQMSLQFDRILLNGTAQFGSGQNKICIEKTGRQGANALVNVRAC